MASENSMIINLKNKINKMPGCCIKKLWSSATNRDIDILIVVYGLACFYEIKVPGKVPTAWQYNRLAFWAASGADTNWYDDIDKLVTHVQQLADRKTFDIKGNIEKGYQWLKLTKIAEV